MSEETKSMLFHWEGWLSALIQQAVRMNQTIENNPLLSTIIQQRDSLRSELRTKYHYSGKF